MKDSIYIRMPRCGSTTVASFCNKNNIKFFGGRDMGFWGYDTIVKENTSPRLYECVSNYVGKEIYDKSFIFTSVRNPYSRAVSMYKHESWRSVETFDDFCNAIKKEEYPSECAKWHSSTLTEHITYKGDLKVDAFVKLESLEEDLNSICVKLDIPNQKIRHFNKSKHKHYVEYYNKETKKIVDQIYADDIERFGYKFGE